MHMYMQIFKDYWQKDNRNLFSLFMQHALFLSSVYVGSLKMAVHVLLITGNKQNYHDMFTAFTINQFTELVFTVNPLICLQYLQLIH